MSSDTPSILRHRTAIRRGDFSRPVKAALTDGLLHPAMTFFDYGCGHGEDIELLSAQGIACKGWDPAFRPDAPKASAEVVSLAFVLNVIENIEERADTLRSAWKLARSVLIVAAQVKEAGRGDAHQPFRDGVVTGRSTFQKFFGQCELREFIETSIEADAVPASLGIFYVFRDETLRQHFLASRYRRTPAAPRKRISELKFEEHREILEAFMTALAELGRVPEPDEFGLAEKVIEEFGSLKRAFALVRRVTGEEDWEVIRQRRKEDMLVYLALARFRKRPAARQLPMGLQRDVRAFFGNYTKAQKQADELLFQAGNPEIIDAACQRSVIGKHLPDDLYIHRCALNALEPVLRVYEGCGRAYLGVVDGANIIKIHRRSGKLSYLVYPGFEDEPHPILVRSIRVNLRSRQIDSTDYSQSPNPPVLHRKETFLPAEHELKGKFARLTEQEEKQGLLDDASVIGTLEGWRRRLSERGFELRGHRLIRAKVNNSSETAAGST
jgi:DNA phosphorothioation-associated putative methyltransferase